MNWIIVFVLGYVFFYWINTSEKQGRIKILTLCLCSLGLRGLVYLSNVYEGYLSDVDWMALLFLFLGNGCVYLLKVKRKYWFLHGVSLVCLVFIFFTQWAENETVLELNLVDKTLFLVISVLSFFYGCYGYCCVINNFIHQILKPYVVFYIVVLFCVALSFLVLYFYDYLFQDCIHQLFDVISLSLVVGAFVFEVKLFTFLRYQQAIHTSFQKGWTQQRHRLFGEVFLDISVSQVEKRPLGITQATARIDLNHLPPEVSNERILKRNKRNEIRQLMTEQLIETRLFLDPSLNLEQLSSMLNLQKSELIGFFKASESATFKQYLNRLRVEYAILLIRDNEENFTVEELSLLCGFNTRLSFYRAFVEIFGFAPSEIMS